MIDTPIEENIQEKEENIQDLEENIQEKEENIQDLEENIQEPEKNIQDSNMTQGENIEVVKYNKIKKYSDW